MLPVAYLAAAFTLAVVFTTIAAMIITALDPKYVHPALRKLQRRMQTHIAPEAVRKQERDAQGQPLAEDGLAIFDELIVAEHEHEFASDAHPEFSGGSAPTLVSDALPQAEALLFLRAEIGVQLGFDLDIRGTTANLTRRQYRKLVEYTAFAFATVETPEAYLGRHGITQIYFVPRRSRAGLSPFEM